MEKIFTNYTSDRRSVSHLTLIREVYCYANYEQKQRITKGGFETLSSKKDVFIKVLPSELSNLYRRGSGKIARVRGDR